MLRQFCLATFLVSSFLFSSLSALAANNDDLDELRAQNNDWTLVKNDIAKQIKTYDKREQNKRMRSFKIDATFNAPVESVAAVYFDIENYDKWFWQVLDRRIIKKASDTEFYYYLQHRAPVGLPIRDVVIHASIEPYSKNHPYVGFRLKAVPEFIPKIANAVRMEVCDMYIKWTPMDNNTKTHEEVEGYIDPSGNIPSWANTAVQRLAPYWTMVALQRMLQLPEYRNSPVLPFKIYDYSNR
mgnify:CR=1 FL=1